MYVDPIPEQADNRQHPIYPQSFGAARPSRAAELYLADRPTRKLCEFFKAKGLPALKEEDRREQWYDDWLAYQAEHRIYASILSPRAYSRFGCEFSLLRLTRFVEVFAYFSPAHGYSFQCSFLGLWPILMGTDASLKQEAIVALEAGGLFAFAVSEKDHGADLLGNEFTVREDASGKRIANGSKYYIGNCNRAGIISILARKEDLRRAARGVAAGRRAPILLFALRPAQSPGLRNVRKIHTIGIRPAFVGEFEVKDHELTNGDVIAEGRDAWDAVFGTVTLGKFFLGFASIGICQRAFEEAVAHLGRRTLYGKPVTEMPHIRSRVTQAYARLTAMKMYAYRALDYVQAANADDRRYLLFAAVQKARVSTEGVKVVALLSECIGAKGCEADTYFEMALRDVQLIPSLEGSTHINLGLAAQFIPGYFGRPGDDLADPKSLIAGEAPAGENPYLMEARSGPVNAIRFGHFLKAYRPLVSMVPNVRLFARQAKTFALFIEGASPQDLGGGGTQRALALGQCLATITYGQLIAENALLLNVPLQVVSVIFDLLILDLAAGALAVASTSRPGAAERTLIRRTAVVADTPAEDWDFVAERVVEAARRQAHHAGADV